MSKTNVARRREMLLARKRVTDLTLSTGFVVSVRRPPLAQWIAAGELPESLFGGAVAEIRAGRDGIGGINQASDVDMPEIMGVALKVAKAACVWPKLVEGASADSEDELDPSDLSPNELMEIFNWAMTGSTGAPVRMEGGEAAPEDLKSIRQDSEVSGAGADGGEIREESGA